MIIEQGLRIVFGAAPLPFSIPPALRGQILIGDFIYSRYRLLILAIAAAAVAATWFIVYRTAFGRVVRAGVQNPDMVGALGISLKPYMTAIAALGVGLAGLAGALLAPLAGVHPAMGAEILTAAFVVVVIGGLGSFWGVIAAALLVGVVRGITIRWCCWCGRAGSSASASRSSNRRCEKTTSLSSPSPLRSLSCHSRSISSDCRCDPRSMSSSSLLPPWA